jgi:hypothetical protein
VTADHTAPPEPRQRIEAWARVEYGYFLLSGADDVETDPLRVLGDRNTGGFIVTRTGVAVPSRAEDLDEVRVVVEVLTHAPDVVGAEVALLTSVGPYLRVSAMDGTVAAVAWLAPGHDWSVVVTQTGASPESWLVRTWPTGPPPEAPPGTLRAAAARRSTSSPAEVKRKVHQRTGFRPL